MKKCPISAYRSYYLSNSKILNVKYTDNITHRIKTQGGDPRYSTCLSIGGNLRKFLLFQGHFMLKVILSVLLGSMFLQQYNINRSKDLHNTQSIIMSIH